MTDDKPKTNYARGGYIAAFDGSRADSVPFQLSRGHALISLKSYRALTPQMRERLFSDSDVEIVLTADEVRELGGEVLEKLQAELDWRADVTVRESGFRGHLTDLWFVLPDWAFNLVLRVFRVNREAMHEQLCRIWTCRCG